MCRVNGGAGSAVASRVRVVIREFAYSAREYSRAVVTACNLEEQGFTARLRPAAAGTSILSTNAAASDVIRAGGN